MILYVNSIFIVPCASSGTFPTFSSKTVNASKRSWTSRPQQRHQQPHLPQQRHIACPLQKRVLSSKTCLRLTPCGCACSLTWANYAWTQGLPSGRVRARLSSPPSRHTAVCCSLTLGTVCFGR